MTNLLRGKIIRHYLGCALWSSAYCGSLPEYEAPESMEDVAGEDDVTPETVQAMRDQCAAFLFNARRMLRPFIARDGLERTLERAGHDLWLTAQGHGAGFWDGDWQYAGVDFGSAYKRDSLTGLAKMFGFSGALYHDHEKNQVTLY